MPNFGIEFFGTHAIIKLRVKISDTDMNRIREEYPELHLYPGARGTVAIEGCLTSSLYMGFKTMLKDCTLSYKIAKLEAERANLYGLADVAEDELPF